jgi:hypothetical protein
MPRIIEGSGVIGTVRRVLDTGAFCLTGTTDHFKEAIAYLYKKGFRSNYRARAGPGRRIVCCLPYHCGFIQVLLFSGV